MTTGTDVTYWTLIVDAAQRHPDRPLFADDYGRSLSARQLHDAACATAAGFAERGIGADSIVSWQLPTTLETVVVMAALTRLGAVQNPIIPILREREVGFITGHLSTEFLVVPEVWRGFDYGELARALASDQGFEVIAVDLATLPRADELRLPRADVDILTAPATPGGDTQWIYYSSGTTAAPKGIRHSDTTVIAGSRGMVHAMGFSAGDVDPIAFPISHIGGAAMVAAALMTGMRLALFEVFDPAATPQAIAAHQPTFLGTATPFFVAFLEAQRAQGDRPLFGALRGCIAGGAPITAELGRQVRETLGIAGIANAWGMTEFPVATSPALDAAPEVLDYTVGAPVAGVSVRVVDNHETELSVGHEGELRLKGPQCFLGYADATLDVDAFDDEGWLRTGDLGLIDTDGNVRVTGRIKDATIRNAENISALEIENVLATHPGVADVAVIGVPDRSAGERVCAVVVPTSAEGVSLEALVQHCHSLGLGRYKHPERLVIVDSLPRNQFGKVIKKDLREACSRP
ncbi:AMP-binding protein [Mycobacterium montefiorense]|uniref:Cyclohexanecarboxylate-CoA ligase n=1 Tax=Mycobacterium montefiorense TaxID=154654 RepID=A0AA37PI95_9MYCO|nr:AMP-binding protein [Mycobacterium montefiorense]GBG37419.1 cyclohexanecarboxylate-CoA ligase [Mycobacterium montefiorense]GKU36634.1 cyclohexanecarboxylate-CoA ligase [Mycobacterium montefiorense]GKU42181.1 cyclohexanecarboxylate-CoA ligase [Mycobacterium montefiorense]GKU45892.1 cyclohexanecarboxylate-CoA ligase [Mycobacterium montefiorense]GKU52916.1 cyclohexanecarboxylate-CoA ligase [Mycobacterium montefiorense]